MEKTKNYGMFRIHTGNRFVDPNHVKRIKKSILERNLLHVNPIIVNDRMEVLDGQHRLEAAKELEVEIHYIKQIGGLETIHLLNTNARNWSLRDYVLSYISMGSNDYIELLDFSDKWGIPLGLAGALLQFGKAQASSGERDHVRSGDFKPLKKDEAEEIMVWVSAFNDYTDPVTLHQRNFISAVTELKNSGITLDGLKHKLKIQGKQMYRRATRMDYIRDLETLINYKNRHITRIA